MLPLNDASRRELARTVRACTVEEFHDRLAAAGVSRAYIVHENGELRLSHPRLLAPLRAFFELSHDFAGHEAVFIGREPGIPTLFLACVHDTRRGLGQGGLRYKSYPNLAELLVDGLRLAQGMTRKNALAGLHWGGGKGLVALSAPLAADPAYRTESTPERLALFRAYGRFVASLGGIYYTAEDVGTKTSDMNAILGANRFVTCIGSELGGSGNPSPYTARGVFRAIQAAWHFLHGSEDLRGVRVAIQGIGNVGWPLAEALAAAGARLIVTDVDPRALEAAQRRWSGTEVAALDAIYDADADIFAPCAVGAVVNQHTIPRLKVKLVCGAANNILENMAEDAERLRQREILFVPDFLCNRMGITNCCDEWQGYLPEDVRLAAERVFPDTLRVLRHARDQRITTMQAAFELADLAAADLNPLIGHRGRRLIDRLVTSGWASPDGPAAKPQPAMPRSAVIPAFDPGVDEPPIRTRWARSQAFVGSKDGRVLAAAPISAAGRPHLGTFFSALLMDVIARAAERLDGERPHRWLGADHGGLALQQAVERNLPHARNELGRPAFFELCRDAYRRHDAAVREQLHLLGVGFDPHRWLDPMGPSGERVARRLYYALDDAGLVERRAQQTSQYPWRSPIAEQDGERVYVDLRQAALRLRRAVEMEAITFSGPRWKRDAEALIERILAGDERWSVSRPYWWGQEIPGATVLGDQVLSVFFSMVAATLQALGWPERAEPEPIDEVFVDAELFERWALMAQMVALLLTGRPAFRHLFVHAGLHILDRELEIVPGVPADAPDEERLLCRQVRRPMRRRLGNVVEPATLIARFGADALRLGYLLSLHADPGAEVATAAESHLRLARRTVRRLVSKVTGIFHLPIAAEAGALDLEALPTADLWLLGRLEWAEIAATESYHRGALGAVGHLLADMVNDLAIWCGIAARRGREGSPTASIRPVLATAIDRLASAFAPICPFLFDQLGRYTRDRAEVLAIPASAKAIAVLVDAAGEAEVDALYRPDLERLPLELPALGATRRRWRQRDESSSALRRRSPTPAAEAF
jgi:glutamate dehydrogenase/leucine dehydrogenase